MKISKYPSPLGLFYLWFKEGRLIYASFLPEEGQKWLAKRFPGIRAEPSPLAACYQKDLDTYFSGQQVHWQWPLQLVGTPFQRQVWLEIQKIPYGQFATYKKIATALHRRAFQAVGQAVGANPISVIVPCHRVLGTNWLGGYGGGLNRKRLLLELENTVLPPRDQA